MTIVLDWAYSGSTEDSGPIINKIVASKALALLGGDHYAQQERLRNHQFKRFGSLDVSCRNHLKAKGLYRRYRHPMR
jgi:hypothetical protein